MAKRDIHTFVIPLCRKLADELGYELVDVELVKEGPGRYLRIYLDRDGSITLDDCETFHRAVQPRLEAVDYDFLEVSSPGIDRPLKTDQDFARAMETEIEVKLFKPIEGTKELTGTLVGYDENAFRVLTQAGERVLARRDAAVIKPVIAFEDDEGEDEP